MNLRKKNKILWIAWEKQRRSTTLAKELGAGLYQLESALPSLLRYIELSVRTIQILVNGQFKYVFAQNPSIILCLLIVVQKKILNNMKVIIDSHTPYLKLTGLKRLVFDFVTRMIYHGADLVIITNTDLKSIYEKRFPKASFCVLPDKIPEFNNVKVTQLSKKSNILLICTYAEDEPYIEAFKAMNGVKKATLYVTGNKKKASNEAMKLKPDNVILTGFLSDSEYVSLLNSVDIVMDLTDIENCMVCGAYEAVATEKPMILSDKKVLVEYFDEGVIYTRNDSENIARSIRIAMANIDTLIKGIIKLKSKRSTEWRGQWIGLLDKLGITQKSG